jgi:hypothetical protein
LTGVVTVDPKRDMRVGLRGRTGASLVDILFLIPLVSKPTMVIGVLCLSGFDKQRYPVTL